MSKIFISYRRSDADVVAHRMFDWLVEEFGSDAVFIDIDRLPLGGDFRSHINEQILQASLILAVIGDTWLDSLRRRGSESQDWVRFELETALDIGKHIIPILIDRTPMPDVHQLPPSLSQLSYLNAAAISSTKDFRYHMNELARVISSGCRLKRKPKQEDPASLPRQLVGQTSYRGPRAPLPSNNEQWKKLRLPKPNPVGDFNGIFEGELLRLFYRLFARERPFQPVWVSIYGDLNLVLLNQYSSVIHNFKSQKSTTRILRLNAFNAARGVKLVAHRDGVYINTGRSIINWPLGHSQTFDVCSVHEYNGDVVGNFCASPDRKWIAIHHATGSNSYRIALISTANGKKEFDVEGTALLDRLSFSRSGQHLLASPNIISDQSAVLVSISDRKTESLEVEINALKLSAAASKSFHGPAIWHPTQDVFAIAGSDRETNSMYIELFEAPSLDSLHRRTIEHSNDIIDIDWSPDGRFIASASNDQSAIIWDLVEGRTTILTGHTSGLEMVRFSADGLRLLTFSRPNEILIWDPRNGSKLSELSGIAHAGSWGPDPRMIIIQGSNGTEIRALTG